MKCVILAGGKGTRISKQFPDIPKPMIPIGNKPVLEHQIEHLCRHGITEIIIITGYMSEVIENYFGNGSKYGIDIKYYKEISPLGTAGALPYLNIEEDFLLCSGDLLFNFSPKKMLQFHQSNDALVTIFCHPSKHPFDSTLIDYDESNIVLDMFTIDEKADSFFNCCSAGIYCISPKLLEKFNNNERELNLDKDIIYPSLDTKKIFAYKSVEYVSDMGTPERKAIVENDYLSNKLNQKRKAIFLDRDGTLNIYKGYITDKDDIELTHNAYEAINIFHQKGYLVIVITNQPVIARGDCTMKGLKEIHNRINCLLAKKGAYLDDIFVCPHHPDKGFAGEIESLKIDCDCRKPKPGLIIEASKKYDINLNESYMVGDSLVDIQCAKNAGCIPVHITNTKNNFSKHTYSNLLEFANSVLL